jgi:hypothetical protein
MGVTTNLQPLGSKRRNLIIATCALFFLLLIFYTQLQSDADRIKAMIPIPDEEPSETSKTAASQPKEDSKEDDSKDSKPEKAFVMSSDPDKEKTRVSHLHFLIPASDANVELCYNLVSSVINRYVPMLLGYHGTDLFDAAETHLAKLRAIKRYLDGLPKVDDDDLVAIVDGYDIIMQLPADIMIERYFQMRDKADARLAERFGVTVAEARKLGLRQTIFWGPDKICWPIDKNEPRCWAVPESGLPSDAFGPNTGNGKMLYNDPRWLNSGTVIAPVADMRKYIDATMVEIDETYDADFANRESDQYYLANVWGRQEYFRSLQVNAGQEVEGPEAKKLPAEKDVTEYHISIDYESMLFQTKAGYEPFFGYLEFNQSGLNAVVEHNFTESDHFEPFEIQMPASVVASMTRIFEGIAHMLPGVHAGDWIRDLKLGANFITQHIYVLWHCTGPKEWIASEYERLWFYPYAAPLIKAAVKASQEESLLTEAIIDGRRWATKMAYPDAKEIPEPLGGAWTDLNGTSFVSWSDMCSEHAGILFGGQHDESEQ